MNIEDNNDAFRIPRAWDRAGEEEFLNDDHSDDAESMDTAKDDLERAGKLEGADPDDITERFEFVGSDYEGEEPSIEASFFLCVSLYKTYFWTASYI